MPQTRIHRLQAEIRRQELDCLAVVPGPNLFYLTGVDFHLSERPTVGFIPAEGDPVFALPVLEVNKLQAGLDYEARISSYSDTDGPQAAFREAMAALPEVHRIAFEDLKMRLLEFKLLRQHVPSAEYVPADPVMAALRMVKGEDEIAHMRQAIAVTEQALVQTVAAVRPGMTEREIANRLMVALLEAGGGMLPFQPIVLTGPKSALPHGVPGERVMQAGDILLIDFGTTSEGYVSDITRTFVVGREPETRLREIYEAVQAANAAGREAAKPGVACQEVDRAARKVIEDAGYGDYFIHRTGHGVGLEGHEEPYMVEGNERLLAPGMTFTVEPGIYIPDFGGVRIEDDMVITEDGSESLTTFDRTLHVVGT
jgi:Xaa-Pro dipeptidase